MVALRLDNDPRAPQTWTPPSSTAPQKADAVPDSVDTLTTNPRARLELGFEPQAQRLMPVEDLPRTPSALGRWWGKISRSAVVKATLLGASSFVIAMGAQIGSLRRAEAAPTAKTKREIVFVGLNPGAKHEAQRLAKQSPDGVAFVGPARLQDKALVKGRLVDLDTPEGRAAFVSDLGLEGAQAAALERTLERTDGWGKDEMARLSRLFAEAERGDRVIERLVLSGHSLGAGLWGDDNGELSWQALAALAEAFPKAARQVEDVMVAACYAGGRTQMKRFRAMFPHVQSIWGYAGSAPGAYSGAVYHLAKWEQQTRGPGSARVRRESVQKLRKGKNVAVWTRARGYEDGRPARPLAELQRDYARTRDVVPIFLSGVRQVKDPGRGPLREHYDNLQALLQRPELPEAERAPLEAEREMVIRLIYYGRVSGYFERAHGELLDRAYAALDRPRPDFSRLPRERALAEILAFAKAAGPDATPELRQAEALLTDGLRDLSPDRIPSSWL